jgi:hypothetical protein
MKTKIVALLNKNSFTNPKSHGHVPWTIAWNERGLASVKIVHRHVGPIHLDTVNPPWHLKLAWEIQINIKIKNKEAQS